MNLFIWANFMNAVSVSIAITSQSLWVDLEAFYDPQKKNLRCLSTKSICPVRLVTRNHSEVKTIFSNHLENKQNVFQRKKWLKEFQKRAGFIGMSLIPSLNPHNLNLSWKIDFQLCLLHRLKRPKVALSSP